MGLVPQTEQPWPILHLIKLAEDALATGGSNPQKAVRGRMLKRRISEAGS